MEGNNNAGAGLPTLHDEFMQDLHDTVSRSLLVTPTERARLPRTWATVDSIFSQCVLACTSCCL